MKLSRFRPHLVILLLSIAALACFQQSRSEMNNGKGARDNPVSPRKYAVTSDFSIAALSVVRRPITASEISEATQEASPDDLQFEYLKVQFQVKCNLADEKICDLSEIGTHVQLVSDTGILINPTDMENSDSPLAGEILGDAEKTGWLIFKVPIGMVVTTAVVRYDDGEMLFFALP
ncbi:MAG TPA: hypothetical protein VHP83_23730 [Aggregatilineaceae bacterium]|nr:hypothetical protein [Aggregatilineaceae bacterium]